MYFYSSIPTLSFCFLQRKCQMVVASRPYCLHLYDLISNSSCSFYTISYQILHVLFVRSHIKFFMFFLGSTQQSLVSHYYFTVKRGKVMEKHTAVSYTTDLPLLGVLIFFFSVKCFDHSKIVSIYIFSTYSVVELSHHITHCQMHW